MTAAVPMLLRRYGLRPWELDRLTAGELDALLEDVQATVKGGS